jgi:hypothetical protein
MPAMADLPRADDVRQALRREANPAQAVIHQRFFETDKAQYAVGGLFFGFKARQCSAIRPS